MRIILTVMSLFLLASTSSTPLTVDFGTKKDGLDWRITNDGVMGGQSQGQVQYTPNSLLFTGTVSLANGGGFTSFKSPFSTYDLSDYQTLELRVRGSGCAIGFTLETSRQWFQPYYKHMFSPNEEWQTIRIPLTDFKAYRLGRTSDVTLDQGSKADIVRIGFITDKQAGPFELEVESIQFLP